MLNCSLHIILGDGVSGSACKRGADWLYSSLSMTNPMFRIWNALWFIGIAIFYFPISQTRAHGKTSKEILKRIDYLGGFLSITGLTLLLVGPALIFTYSNLFQPRRFTGRWLLSSLGKCLCPLHSPGRFLSDRGLLCLGVEIRPQSDDSS
jgi:hypothetical protein